MKNKYGREPVFKEIARAKSDSKITCWGCSGTGQASYGECCACGGSGIKELHGEWVMVVDINWPEPFSIAEFFEEDGTI